MTFQATKTYISIIIDISIDFRYMDLSKQKTEKALEAIIELEAFTQYEVWKKAGTSFETAHNLVHFLQQKNVIAKTDKKYAVTTWPGLLSLFAAYRTFPKPTATLQLAIDEKQFQEILCKKGFTLCLTTAWSHYDDYLYGGNIHAYYPDEKTLQNLVKEASQLPKGLTTTYLHPQDIPVQPEKKGKLQITSFARTLLDMYSSNYAYGTSNWIKKKAMR